MTKHLLSITLVFISLFANAQTFTNTTGGAITDNNAYIYYPIIVSGLSPTTINSSTFGLENVKINLTHTNDADLRIKLQSPSGSIYVLSSYYGGTGDNYTNTTFTDSAVNPISGGTAPFTGYFRCVDGLVSFNNGQAGNGTWNLMIKDQTVGNTGTLLNWSITFGTHPAGAINFTHSNLPIIVINTGGVAIPTEPKIAGTMGIIYNGAGVTNYITDPANNYNGNIGIEIRGAYSASLPQKPYNLELRDSAGIQIDAPILGMPAGSDWCLIANYNDKVFMRNTLAYSLFSEMGHYATRTKHCEVVLNGAYMGVFVFCEAIRRDSARVDIAHLDSLENTGNNVTGGYIIKNDYWGTTDSWQLGYHPIGHPTFNVHLVYEYPKPTNITLQQKTYIQTFVNDFETALYGANYADTAVGYQRYISVNSWLDYLIVNEVARNNDGFKKSCYYHKDKDDSVTNTFGKLKMGPVWDFDWAYKNIPGCAQYAAIDGSGWSYKINDCNPDVNSTGWMVRLLQDVAFQNKLRCRWATFRSTILSNAAITNYVDSFAIYLDSAQMRHFAKWGNLGVNTGAPEVEADPTTWAGEITKFKNWLSLRLTWLDANIPGTCSPATANFTATTTTTICIGSTVSFHDASTYFPTSWSWSFPGGTPSTSTLENPIVTYNTAGTYNVTLTATNGGGTGTPVTLTNFVTVTTGSSVSVNSIAICAGAVATLTATGATSYSWSAGASVTGVNTATASPASTTTYTVTGTGLGCTSTAIATVTVNPIPSVAVNSTGICAGDIATLTATGATSYTWSAGATVSGVNTATANPITTTTYTVTGTDAGCSATATATILVSSAPAVTVNSISICNGDTATLTATGATSYTWSAGTTVTGTNTAEVNPATTTSYTVTGTDVGCSATATATVTVNPVPIVNVNDALICSGDIANFTATGATSYVWSTGATTTGINTATANPTTTTTYTVIGTGLFCSATATATVTVNPLPLVTVNSVTICDGDTAMLAASGASSYVWSVGVNSTGISTASATPSTTTSYTVTGTNLGCSATAVATVTVGTTPPTPTITSVGNVLTSSATTGNQWYMNGVLILGANSQYFTMFVDGTYTVVVSNNGCLSAESSPFVYTTVGITDSSDDEINIYPNPATNELRIADLKLRIGAIELYDVLGNMVIQSTINNQQSTINLDISTLAKGIYFCKLYLNTRVIETKQVVVIR